MINRIKVFGMAAAVFVPFAVLSAIAVHQLGKNARRDIERTVVATVDACMAAVEREVERHVAVNQTLGTAADDDLGHLQRHAALVLDTMRPDWLNVVLARGAEQVFNLHRANDPGPLPPTRDPAANARVAATQRSEVDGVQIDHGRQPEPFIIVRTPVRQNGKPSLYALIGVVRAWAFTEVLKECGVPEPGWRMGLTDQDGRIVGRNSAQDPRDGFIGQPASASILDGLSRGERFFFASSRDGVHLYIGVARSERYGWSVNLGVPSRAVDAVTGRVHRAAAALAAIALLLAGLMGWQTLRVSARVATTRRLEGSLREKDTLLREIHHRVKNNLQAVSGMMQFERSRIADPYARSRIEVVMQRVLVMGRIHQQLYESASLSRIDFARHLGDLVAAVRESLDPDRVTLTLEAETLHCDLETALPLGLIVHELISNAQKHAFPGERTGTVRITFRRAGDEVRLVVCDDGVGQTGSLPGIGMVLVEALARQCGAEVGLEYNGGCCATVTIPGGLFHDRGDTGLEAPPAIP